MLLFPVIPVGLSTEHKNFCGSVTVRPDTYYHLLYDICVSLAHHGFKKLAFLVCHGGNAADCAGFKPGNFGVSWGLHRLSFQSGAFGHSGCKSNDFKGNMLGFPRWRDGDIGLVMAVDESLVKLELSEAGEPTAFEKNPAP